MHFPAIPITLVNISLERNKLARSCSVVRAERSGTLSSDSAISYGTKRNCERRRQKCRGAGTLSILKVGAPRSEKSSPASRSAPALDHTAS